MANYIPDHILVDVLVRLPFQSLCRFKCVSKSWRDFIDSSYVRGNHSRRSRLIQTYPHPIPDSKIIALSGGKKFFAFDSVDKKGKANAKQLRMPTTKFSDPYFQIVGSCNGIIYLKTTRHIFSNARYFLWNPFIIGSYFELPSLPDEFKLALTITQALGYDRINDDYKVVRWFGEFTALSHKLCVYSLKHKSWQVIRASIPFELPKCDYNCKGFYTDCIMANGCAHWLYWGSGECFIVAFDLETYEYRKLSCDFYPFKVKYIKTLSCLNGCLSLVYDDLVAADIWVMEKYGVETSWKKIASISSLIFVRSSRLVAVLQKGRKLLLKVEDESRNELVSYDIGTKSVCKVAIEEVTYWRYYGAHGSCYYSAEYCVCVCVGSFVNPASYSVDVLEEPRSSF